MKPIPWFWIRVTIVALSAFGGFTGNFKPFPSQQFLLVLSLSFFVGLIGTRIHVFREYKKQNNQVVWLLPAWQENPFQAKQPFQFFHLAGFSFLALGLAAAVQHFLTSGKVDVWPGSVFAASFGAGILAGIGLAVYANKGHFVSRGRHA